MASRGTDLTLSDVLDEIGSYPEPDSVLEACEHWAQSRSLSLYDHQRDALIATLSGANTIITTPTGSGKTLIASLAQVATMARRGRVYYTAPIKALVSEKFFAWCEEFGADNVGMVTGDASVNPDASLICCTAEILANEALRHGGQADIDMVIADEYHFIADPDRGWAWQIATSELPQAQFMLMSATLGDVSDLASQLTTHTGRETVVIDNAIRPVPLHYRYSLDPLDETVSELVLSHQWPIYLVHPSQVAAIETAHSYLSTPLIGTEHRRKIAEALQGFRFSRGFGAKLSRLLKAGIGVHHAGLLPKYRRLVENLAQRGLLVLICGTDTLGVGINVPIRTVLFTTIVKFDGRRDRIMRSREFHQIAGRAGRPGFDAVGNVIVQAPAYQIENARIAAKYADNAKKLKSVRKKKPADGEVSYSDKTFDKLVSSIPETLHGRIRITHSMLINLLDRDADTAEAVRHIVDSSISDPALKRRLYRHAIRLGRSLIASQVVVRRNEATPGGRLYDLAEGLQDDFALNQPLSAFAMDTIEHYDPDSPTFALDIVSIIESTLEDPRGILYAQQKAERARRGRELADEGYDYAERRAILDEITWPQPLAEELTKAHQAMSARYPWLVAQPLCPKSIVRDMSERAMNFAEYVAFYSIERYEGLLLRYLSDALKALKQTVPPWAHSEELEDIIVWLAHIIRSTDSSLVDEWETMMQIGRKVESDPYDGVAESTAITSNLRAFKVMVRNAMFRRIQLAAEDDVEALSALDDDDEDRVMSYEDWDEALGDYWEEHDEIGVDAQARSPRFFIVDDSDPRHWHVRQFVDDPEQNHDWHIEARVDLDECDHAEELRLHIVRFSRYDHQN